MSMRDAITEGACGFEATGTVAGGTGRRRGVPANDGQPGGMDRRLKKGAIA